MRLFGLNISSAKKDSIIEDEIKKEQTKIKISETRRINEEIKEVERQIILADKELELQDARDRLSEYYDEEEEPQQKEDDPLNSLLLGVLSGLKNQNQNNPPLIQQPQTQLNTMPQLNSGIELSEQAIKVLLEDISPKYLKIARKMPDTDLKNLIKTQTPYNLSEETLNKAVILVKK